MAEQAWQKISEFKGIATEAILNKAYNFFFFQGKKKSRTISGWNIRGGTTSRQHRGNQNC